MDTPSLGIITSETIMKCFIKSGFPSLNFSADDLLDVQEVDTELQELINLANTEIEIYTDTTDYTTIEEDTMQLHQLDSSNWEEELLSIQPIEHASLTLASQDDPNSDIEDEQNSLPSSTEAIQSLHTLMTFIKNQPNQEQLLEKCMNIEVDLRLPG